MASYNKVIDWAFLNLERSSNVNLKYMQPDEEKINIETTAIDPDDDFHINNQMPKATLSLS